MKRIFIICALLCLLVMSSCGPKRVSDVDIVNSTKNGYAIDVIDSDVFMSDVGIMSVKAAKLFDAILSSIKVADGIATVSSIDTDKFFAYVESNEDIKKKISVDSDYVFEYALLYYVTNSSELQQESAVLEYSSTGKLRDNGFIKELYDSCVVSLKDHYSSYNPDASTDNTITELNKDGVITVKYLGKYRMLIKDVSIFVGQDALTRCSEIDPINKGLIIQSVDDLLLIEYTLDNLTSSSVQYNNAFVLTDKNLELYQVSGVEPVGLTESGVIKPFKSKTYQCLLAGEESNRLLLWYDKSGEYMFSLH